GSPRRAVPRSALPVREGEPGHPLGGDDVPTAGYLEERVLRLGGSSDVPAPTYVPDAHQPNSRHPPPLARGLRLAEHSCGLADDHGIHVGRKRVARLMRQSGIKGASLRKYVVPTQK